MEHVTLKHVAKVSGFSVTTVSRVLGGTDYPISAEARDAISKILSAGWLITNQLVYTVTASRRGHTTRLRQVLNSLGVVCYYTFSVKGFNEKLCGVHSQQPFSAGTT